MINALILLNAAAWTGAAILLCGSLIRLLRNRQREGDELLAVLSLLSALLALFFARRIILSGDPATFAVLCIMSLFLSAYVYRIGWGLGDAGK